MDRRLMTLGSSFLLATAALWVAGAADWMPDAAADRWSSFTWKAAIVLLVAGLLARALSPVKRVLREERCTACGRPTLRGHAFCSDHLQETVNAARDRASERSRVRPSEQPFPPPRT